MSSSLATRQSRNVFAAASMDSSHLQRLRPLRVADRGGLERFVIPALRELPGTAFALSSDEERFVYELLGSSSRQGLRKHNLWVFRVHQKKFAGDFVIVDVSSSLRSQAGFSLPWWDVFVLDVKMNAPLKLGGGGAGIQLRFANEAALVAVFESASQHGIVPEQQRKAWLRLMAPRQVWQMTGSRQALLGFFDHTRDMRRALRRGRGDLREVERAHREVMRCAL